MGTSIGRYGGLIKEITADAIIYYDYYEEKGEWKEIIREMRLQE